mgnify:CR=1 FL=1
MNVIKFEMIDDVCLVTINREKHLNALNTAVLNELTKLFIDLNTNKKLSGVIITGEGSKSFVAGADIKELSELTAKEAKSHSQMGQNLTKLIENFNKPVIAAVNGFALGGGCELAMACHIRYASENAMFGQPEVALGLIAGFGGTQRLPRLIGKGIAMELLLTGKMINALEAKAVGLVNEVVTQNELLAYSLNVLKKIKRNGPLSVNYSIQSINEGLDCSLENGLTIEAEYFKKVFESSDCREGMLAFIEKRKADFSGK